MPLMRPTAAPTTTPAGMASAAAQGSPIPTMLVATIAAVAITQGIDRSMCPSRITTIAPAATTPRKAAM